MNTFRGWLPVYAAAAEGDALAALGAKAIGVGKVAAAIGLAEVLQGARSPGVLLFGVCGAYPARHHSGTPLQIGDVVVVARDRFGDEGVATPDGFRDLAALGLPALGPFAADAGATRVAAQLLAAACVDGATVSTGSGTEALSRDLAARSGAAIETMEGAAVAAVCARAGVPWLQVRAVSNWTGDRARGAWDLPRAVAAVQVAVRRLLGA